MDQPHTTRPFRFGVVAGHAPDPEAWQATARRAEQLDYDVLLVPDSLGGPSPLPALATAAAVTSRIRVGTHVLAAPFRTPGTVAREADTLDLLSDGRLELGLGTGRPDAEVEAGRLGIPWPSPGERLGQVVATIEAVRETFAETGADLPPVMLAGIGPRLLELAAREADVLTLGLPPAATEEELGAAVERFRRIGEKPAGWRTERAGRCTDRVELATNLLVVGDRIPPPMRPFLEQMLGVEVETARDNRAYAVLGGPPDQVAERLECRRRRWGISYVTVAQSAMEDFAPVIDMLRDA